MRHIQDWFGFRPTTAAHHDIDAIENEDLKKTADDLQDLIDKALAKRLEDKDVVIRDIQYEALDKLIKIVKVYTALIGIPVGIIIGFFAFEGIKDARSFFASIEPQIRAAQTSINDTQQKLRLQRQELAENEKTIKSMRSRLNDQGRSVDDFRERVATLQPQVAALQSQVSRLTNQTSSIIAQNHETKLEQDFASFGKGDLVIYLDNQTYKPPENPNGRPIVYLTSSASIVSGHDITDIHQFEDGLKRLDYKFVYGSFSIQNGKTAAGGNMIPAPACTQVVYYDVKYLAEANHVADLVATSFRIQVPVVKLIPPDKTVAVDPVSRTIIEASKVNISASVSIPNPLFCEQYLKSF